MPFTMTVDIGQNVSLNTAGISELGILDSMADDLLRLASYVYAADLAIKRHEREQHLRSIRLHLPVGNIQAFRALKLRFEDALTTLSRDNWTLEFTPIHAVSPAATFAWPGREGATLMFSGGLDSLAGAFQLITNNINVLLISHVTHNRTVEDAQTALAAAVATSPPTDVRPPLP